MLADDLFFNSYYYDMVKRIQDANLFAPDQPVLNSFRESIEEAKVTSVSIEIVPDYQCQLKCRWCYLESDVQSTRSRLTLMEYKKLLKRIEFVSGEDKEFDVKTIALLGGEPTTHPNILEIVEETKRAGFKVILVTNGYNLESLLERSRNTFDGIYISIHIPFCGENGDVILDGLVGKVGYSSQLRASIDRLCEARESGLDVSILGNYVLSFESIGFALSSYIFCRERGIDPVFERVRASDTGDESAFPRKKEVYDFIKAIFEYDKRFGFLPTYTDQNRDRQNEIMNELRYFMPPMIQNQCAMYRSSLHIKFKNGTFGNVQPCCGISIELGNVLRDTFEYVINTRRLKLEESHLLAKPNGPCNDCLLDQYVHCDGGCRGNSANVFGVLGYSDPNCLFLDSNSGKYST